VVHRGRAQTNTKAAVINNPSREDVGSEVGDEMDRDKHNDKDCEVSRDSRRTNPWREGID
jgi:hypothetical protein